MKLLPNRTVKVGVDTPDYFNFLTKARAIKYFLENTKDGLKGNNMIVLFGDWGSGKSTLMEHLERELDKKLFKSVFFTAWEHEKDNNLTLSLVDAITHKLGKNKAVKEFVKEALVFFVNLTKGLTIKTSEGLGIGMEYDFGETLKAIEESFDKDKKQWSFYKKINDFKESFIRMEEEVLEKDQKLIVFIDDLDRCEPENVLTLLSAIKLFFSLGERTVFFFGVDKNAVSNAVKTKYGDVIKSDEYMEKVFDISFEMPLNTSMSSLIREYFSEHVIKIEEFLKEINFINPRHVKKVFNKYEILREFQDIGMRSDFNELLPNLKNDKNADFLDVILTLFIIIVYEFYTEIFIELEEYEEKKVEYARVVSDGNVTMNFNQALQFIPNEDTGFCYASINNIPISELIRKANKFEKGRENVRYFLKFLSLFTPKNIPKFNNNINGVSEFEFLSQFGTQENKLLVKFSRFLLKNKHEVLNSKSNYMYSNYFLMARTLL